MAYTPTEWQSGDIVTSAKLNKIENGIAKGIDAFVIHSANSTLDKTWQEIYDALAAEKLAIIFAPSGSPDVYNIEQGLVLGISLVDGTYSLNTTMGAFVASTANDYPALD